MTASKPPYHPSKNAPPCTCSHAARQHFTLGSQVCAHCGCRHYTPDTTVGKDSQETGEPRG